MQTIVNMLFGSHLYGTNTPESDLDYKGVYIPDGKSILLQRVSGSIVHSRDKAEGERNTSDDIDREMYSLQRYLNLLADGQTVAIDMLFAPASVILESNAVWAAIQRNKEKFLTKRSAAFVGYCRTQANKYGIKGSRVAAARKAVELFDAAVKELGTQVRVGEIEDRLRTILDDHTAIVDYPESSNGTLGKFFECCNRKVNFHNTVKAAYEIFSRIYDNYGNRAQLAERNEGIDWKALSHAVRVGQEALELLKTGNVTFPLPNAAHILDIKKGRLGYDVVAAEIEALLEQVEAASETSVLPEFADKDFIEDLVMQAYYESVTSSRQ